MKKVKALLVAFLALACLSAMPGTAAATVSAASAATSPTSVLYAMNYLSPETSTDITLSDLRSSGFDTLIVFSVDGDSSGNLTFFGTPVFTDGQYVGPAGWTDRIKSLKSGTTSITRLGFTLGGSYSTYKTYMNTYGTGSATSWYKNFAALKSMTGADFIDFDDESCYDAGSMAKLGQMLGNIGYKVSLCPYTNASFWQTVKSNLGSIVDEINLQCYDGGAGNNPATWNNYFGGLKVTPLFWTLHAGGAGTTYAQAQTLVANWKNSAGITSAGAWQYSDMRDYSGGTAAQYNAAIRAGLENSTPIISQVQGQFIVQLQRGCVQLRQ